MMVVRAMDTMTLVSFPRGITVSSGRTRGHGAASFAASVCLGGRKHKGKKKRTFKKGKKNKKKSHSGCAASRKRRTVRLTPSQINGKETTTSVNRNRLSSYDS